MQPNMDLFLRKLVAAHIGTLRDVLEIEIDGRMCIAHVLTAEGKETVVDGKWVVDVYPECRRVSVAPRVITAARKEQCSMKHIIGPREVPEG